MWRLYGWFTCLMCLGCIAGAVAWAAYMQYLAIFFAAVKAESIKSAAWFQRQQAAAGYWNAAFLVVYPFEFLLLSVTKLLVLDRMIFFAAAAAAEPSPSSMERTRQEPRPGRLALAGRIVMIAVVAGDCIGIFGNVASAVYWVQGAECYCSSLWRSLSWLLFARAASPPPSIAAPTSPPHNVCACRFWALLPSFS